MPPAPSAPSTANFRLVREFEECDYAYLYPLPGKTLLSCAQDLYVIEGGEVRSDPAYQRGIEQEEPRFLWGIMSVAGSWPGSAWLGTNRTTASAAYGEYFQWTGERWKKMGSAKQLGLPLWEVLPWTEQRAVALLEPPYVSGARLIPLGDKPFSVPRFTRPALPHDHCLTRIYIQATAILGPGDIMVAGWACDVVSNHGTKDTVYNGIGVERLRAGMAHGEFSLVDALPEAPLRSSWEVTALVATGPSQAYLAANCRLNRDNTTGYFARWQGTTFAPQAPPFEGVVNLLWFEQPDVIWATDLQHNLWRGQSGNWVRVPWDRPGGEDTEITQGWALGPNDIWLITRSMSQGKRAIYHRQPLF
jgi:hypothetical protein